MKILLLLPATPLPLQKHNQESSCAPTSQAVKKGIYGMAWKPISWKEEKFLLSFLSMFEQRAKFLHLLPQLCEIRTRLNLGLKQAQGNTFVCLVFRGPVA